MYSPYGTFSNTTLPESSVTTSFKTVSPCLRTNVAPFIGLPSTTASTNVTSTLPLISVLVIVNCFIVFWLSIVTSRSVVSAL